jgi:hypothetical protein
MPLRIGETRAPQVQAVCLALLALVLLAAACRSKPLPPPPPPLSTPSKVISTEGVAYYVWQLRLTGTTQELLVKDGDAQIWLPLSIVQYLRFSGPEKDRYRQGEVVLISGEKVRGEVFVGQLLQGTTDVGYWNMPLSRVRQLGMGLEH